MNRFHQHISEQGVDAWKMRKQRFSDRRIPLTVPLDDSDTKGYERYEKARHADTERTKNERTFLPTWSYDDQQYGEDLSPARFAYHTMRRMRHMHRSQAQLLRAKNVMVS